ncbi:MAG TPA: cupin domain-containing protein [Oscillospiraceae bacterium]|nr:cupin domain-containing protein [Oscillospiraceae bacterium]
MSQFPFTNDRAKMKHPDDPARNNLNPEFLVVNIPQAAWQNQNFRVALWTGDHMQLTLMSIPVNETAGAEVHLQMDQMTRVEDGQAAIQTGIDQNHLGAQKRLGRGDTVFVPAGMWHEVFNIGPNPLKLSNIYAPPVHPIGDVQHTKAEAEAARAARSQ